LSSCIRGSLPSAASKTFGLSFDAQPAAFTAAVRLNFSVMTKSF
jgi:hypothetical protein